MQYPFQVKVNFSKYSNDGLSVIAGQIKNTLTDNIADFPGLPVNMATFGGHLTDYSDILGKPSYHGKTADMKAARKVLRGDLKKNGVFINQFAEGDKDLMSKSGYPFAKTRGPVGALPKAQIKKVTSIEKGFEIELKKIPGARIYMVFAIPTHAVASHDYKKWPWYPFANTKGKITDLDSSVKYTLVAVAIGTDPHLSFSDPVERTTQ